MRHLLPLAFFLAAVVPSAAQQRPAAAAEVVAGWAGFLDDARIDHAVVGGSVRIHLTPGISIGPELVYMRGPGTDRDVFLTGNVTFDLLARRPGERRGTIHPFLVAGGGLMVHRMDFASATFTSYEGAVTGGAGVRAWLTDRVYAIGEARVGWEAHTRVTGGIGMTW
jgi:hypothetical protein